MNDSIIVNGIEMDYIRFGTGKRIFVILPGVDTKSILNSAMAIEAGYRAFAKSYTVYVFDRRKNMPDDYTIRGMASDTAARIEGAVAVGAGHAAAYRQLVDLFAELFLIIFVYRIIMIHLLRRYLIRFCGSSLKVY